MSEKTLLETERIIICVFRYLHTDDQKHTSEVLFILQIIIWFVLPSLVKYIKLLLEYEHT